jgi:hypothetical protein
LKEKEVRNKLVGALNNTGNSNLLVIPESDRWDIAILGCREGNPIFLAGIELKTSVRKKKKSESSWWWTEDKYGERREFKASDKSKRIFKVGTVLRVMDENKNIWLARDDGGFSQAVRHYQHSSVLPKRVLVVGIDERAKDCQISDITEWANLIEELLNTDNSDSTVLNLRSGEGTFNAIVYEPPYDLLEDIQKFNSYEEIAVEILNRLC